MADILKSLKVGEYVSDEKLIDEIERNREAVVELVQAGRAVVDRWDSPHWKDQPHTGEFIASLRAVITKHDTQQTKKGSN